MESFHHKSVKTVSKDYYATFDQVNETGVRCKAVLN